MCISKIIIFISFHNFRKSMIIMFIKFVEYLSCKFISGKVSFLYIIIISYVTIKSAYLSSCFFNKDNNISGDPIPLSTKDLLQFSSEFGKGAQFYTYLKKALEPAFFLLFPKRELLCLLQITSIEPSTTLLSELDKVSISIKYSPIFQKC